MSIKLKEPITGSEILSSPWVLFLIDYFLDIKSDTVLYEKIKENPIWLQTAAFYMYVGDEVTKCLKVTRVNSLNIEDVRITSTVEMEEVSNLEFLQIVQRQRYQYGDNINV